MIFRLSSPRERFRAPRQTCLREAEYTRAAGRVIGMRAAVVGQFPITAVVSRSDRFPREVKIHEMFRLIFSV